MYAVIESGGKQYKVRPGEIVALEKLEGNKGTSIDLNRVLMIENDGSVQVGTPHIAGARVQGEILGDRKDRKVLVFKKKRRKNYRRTRGHRQTYTQIRIKNIEAQS